MDTNTLYAWYTNPYVQMNLLRSVKGRMVHLSEPKYRHKGQKGTPAFSINSFKELLYYTFTWRDMRAYPQNMIMSLAHLHTPVPKAYELQERSTFWDDWRTKITAVDLLIDIDCPTHDDLAYAVASTQLLVDLFDRCMCPYYLRFSGRGFHIVIPDSAFPMEKDYVTANYYQLLGRLVKVLKAEYSELIDRHVVCHSSKIKVPFSISLYGETEGYVCVPIPPTDLDQFTHHRYTPVAVLGDPTRYSDVLHNPSGTALPVLKECGVR